MASFEQRIQFFPPLGRGGNDRSDNRDYGRDREMDVAALGLTPMNHRNWELTLGPIGVATGVSGVEAGSVGSGKRQVTCVANLNTLNGETEEFTAHIRPLGRSPTSAADDVFHCEMRGIDHIALYRNNGPMNRKYIDTGKISLKTGKIKFPDHGTWTPIIESAKPQPQPQPQNPIGSIPLVPPAQAQPQGQGQGQVQAGEKCTKCPPQPSLDELMALVSTQCKSVPCKPVTCTPCPVQLDTQGQDVLIANAARIATEKATAEMQAVIDAQAKKLKGWMWTALIALLALAFLGIRSLLSFYRERKTKMNVAKAKSASRHEQKLGQEMPSPPPGALGTLGTLGVSGAPVACQSFAVNRQPPLYFVSP